jgi:hypothetical protein
MSELGDELHRLADEGAEQARPRPAAEIIRRGDQRRRWRMVGGTVAGLAVAGAITGGILSGVAGGGRPAPDRPASRPVPATTQPATRPAVGTPEPVPSSASSSARPTPTASGGLQPMPTKSG